jgi:hypothetical protein
MVFGLAAGEAGRALPGWNIRPDRVPTVLIHLAANQTIAECASHSRGAQPEARPAPGNIQFRRRLGPIAPMTARRSRVPMFANPRIVDDFSGNFIAWR